MGISCQQNGHWGVTNHLSGRGLVKPIKELLSEAGQCAGRSCALIRQLANGRHLEQSNRRWLTSRLAMTLLWLLTLALNWLDRGRDWKYETASASGNFSTVPSIRICVAQPWRIFTAAAAAAIMMSDLARRITNIFNDTTYQHCFVAWLQTVTTLRTSISYSNFYAVSGKFSEAVHKWCLQHKNSKIYSGGATPGHARSNDLAGRSTALAPPCLLLCFGNSVNRK